jgi:1-acyl-sn-glycerol-3-phosphate acyltransferase
VRHTKEYTKRGKIMVYPIAKTILWPVLTLFIKKIDGVQNIPNKPFIMVANHESYIDGVLLMMAVAWHKNKQLCFFATNEKFTGPIWNTLFNHFGAIRINGSLQKGVKAIRSGKSMGIFPEGGRTYTHKLPQIKHTGVGVLALMTKAPVVPVGIHTYGFWNRHQLLPNFKQNIIVNIGKPITFRQKPTPANVKKTIKTIWKEVRELARISHA